MSEHEMIERDDGGDGGEALLPTVGLTPKEALFVSAFADVESETFGRATLSAEKAGYASPRDSAWKLRRRPRIAAAIAEMEKTVRVQVGKVLSDLEYTRLAALTKGDLATAARCSELQGKHLSMFADVTIVAPDETYRYDKRVAEDTRTLTALLLMRDRPLAIESLQGVAAPAAGTSATPQDAPGGLPTTARDQSIEAPARTIAEKIKALEQARTQAPLMRQESE